MSRPHARATSRPSARSSTDHTQRRKAVVAMNKLRLPDSLHARIGLFCLALFLAVQLPTLWLAYRGNNQVAMARLDADLDHGTRTFRRILDERGVQLELSARVLAGDFAFRKALATADPATVQSALENHSARLRADFGLVLSPNRTVVASTGTASAASPQLLATIAPESDDVGGRSIIVALDRRLVQLAVVPVLAPDPIGWAAFGYDIDQRAANDLKQLVDLEISFVSNPVNKGLDISASTLPRAMHDDLRQHALANGSSTSAMKMTSFKGEAYATNAFALDDRKPPQAMVFTHQSVAAANAPFKQLTNLLSILSVIGIVACAIGSSLLAGAIARPIRSLILMTEAMRSGTKGTHVGGRLTRELQNLADSFNRLIDTLRERDAEVLHLAYFDSLTGLRNRVGFTKIASEFVSPSDASTQPMQHASIALIDLSSSTQINSVLGHEVGDELVRAAAAKLVSALPAPRVVGRLGTHEFAVLITGSDPQQAESILRDVVLQFEQPVFVVNQAIDVRINIGWAQLREDGVALDTVMRRADIALNTAKARPLPLLRFDHAMEADTHTHFALLSELKIAGTTNQLELFYQPKLTMAGTPVGFEALIRWNHPRRGLVMPGLFMNIAEQTGAVRAVTRFVVDAAIAQQSQWVRANQRLPIAVNISARDLQDETFVPFVNEALNTYKIEPSLLRFEITERALMDNLEAAERTLLALKNIGIAVSLDDYGTGYATLTHISRLTVSELKIDRSFVTDLTEHSRNYAIVLSTVQMGHRLNMKVVAEGVETAAELAALKLAGCDELQGFYFAKPMPASAIPQWLTERTV
jgi:diguanylate cyclase